jgi:exosortase A-associated hydrolase 2
MINAEYQQGQLGWWLMTRWQSAAPSGQTLLILPPFAEEANRSRRLFSELCQQLAANGWSCYLPDFYGTGDSQGDFTDIDLNLWQQDLCQWLARAKLQQPVHLLACRFGALQLLAMWPALLQQLQPGKLLFWQPQLDSQKFLQQLFRQHQASNLLLADKAPSASQLLDNDLTVEIAGYCITPNFYRQITALKPDLSQLQHRTLCWLELSTLPQLPLPVAKVWQQLAADPATSSQQLLALPAFWLQQEPLPAAALIEHSLSFLMGGLND